MSEKRPKSEEKSEPSILRYFRGDIVLVNTNLLPERMIKNYLEAGKTIKMVFAEKEEEGNYQITFAVFEQYSYHFLFDFVTGKISFIDSYVKIDPHQSFRRESELSRAKDFKTLAVLHESIYRSGGVPYLDQLRDRNYD